MKFKVLEGANRDGDKFVKTVSERGEHEVVQRATKLLGERAEIAILDDYQTFDNNDSMEKVLKIMLDAYKGPIK